MEEIQINAGPLRVPTEENAQANMDAFASDLVLLDITTTAITRNPDADVDGKYGYQLGFEDGRVLDIEMPGLPLADVRYLDEAGQDIWTFPRIGVGDEVWVWMFALKACQQPGLTATPQPVLAPYEQQDDNPDPTKCGDPDCDC